LLKDPLLRARMGRAGRSLVEREMAIELIVQKHLMIYPQLA